MKELTIEELKQMPGQPVWCPEEEAYGIVMCDKIGQWAGIPFLHGVWYSDDDGVGVEFNHNIIGRKLKCFRVEDKKEIAMPPSLPSRERGLKYAVGIRLHLVISSLPSRERGLKYSKKR